MSKNIKVSVIVPVYNVEKYLSRCIESIINQAIKDIEIILVDDGSPDQSPQIQQLLEIRKERVVYWFLRAIFLLSYLSFSKNR